VAREKAAARAKASRVAGTRALLEKAVSAGISPEENIILKGDLAHLSARVARLNAFFGRDVVELSPFAKLASNMNASAPVAV